MSVSSSKNFDAGSDDSRFLDTPGGMAALIRDDDWASTPLEPNSSWPQSLRTTVSLCLASNFPINIVRGPQHTQIYNDGYGVQRDRDIGIAAGFDAYFPKSRAGG